MKPNRLPQSYLISNVYMPWFAIDLIPIDRPEADDVRRTLSVSTSVGSSDRDILDLNWHVHTRFHVRPVFGDIFQCGPVLAFPVSEAIICRPEGIPECTLGNTIFSSPLPERGSAVITRFGRYIVEEDESHN